MKNSDKKVSILIRTIPGNGELLKRCIVSISQQKYRQIEIILVEDGGDSAEEIVRETETRHDIPVSYFPMGKIGRCAAGNLAMEKASGSLLNFLDDDDEFLPNHCSILVDALEKKPDYDAFYTASYISYSDIISKNPLVIEEHKRELFGWWDFEVTALWLANMFPIQAVMFKKELYEKYGGLDEELDKYEDWDMWLRFSLEKDFIFVPEVTSRFRLPYTEHNKNSRREEHEKFMPVLRRKQKQLLATHHSERLRALKLREIVYGGI